MNEFFQKKLGDWIKPQLIKFLDKECDRALTVLAQLLPQKEVVAKCDIVLSELNIEYTGAGLVKLFAKADVFKIDFTHYLERRIKTGFGTTAPELTAMLPQGSLLFTIDGEGHLDEIELELIYLRQGIKLGRADFRYRIKVDFQYRPEAGV